MLIQDLVAPERVLRGGESTARNEMVHAVSGQLETEEAFCNKCHIRELTADPEGGNGRVKDRR
jgi:hypothetical protein